MEWVETTGKTVDEAKDRALDLLGVDERDAEFDVIEEAKVGFLGRMKSPARVRARVRPTAPRPKVERRDRRRREEKPARSRSRNGGSRSGRAESAATEAAPEAADAPAASAEGGETAEAVATAEQPSPTTPRRRRRRRGGSGANRSTTVSEQGETQDASSNDKGTEMPELSLEEQGRIVSEFLDGLVESFGFDAETSVVEVDEENVEVRVEGENLGLLVGPKGRTLQALTEVARSIVIRHGEGSSPGRVHIDVAGYRQRRREALARFTRDVAQQVIESGTARALEPMSPADRKVVHDTVNELDGVSSTSEGEEPNRRVVITPA